jgi:hypothetical protein
MASSTSSFNHRTGNRKWNSKVTAGNRELEFGHGAAERLGRRRALMNVVGRALSHGQELDAGSSSHVEKEAPWEEKGLLLPELYWRGDEERLRAGSKQEG